MIASLCAAVWLVAAAGQGDPVGQPVANRAWSIASGIESLSIRDVSRSGIPLETSPVSLDADAWMLAVTREGRRQDRSHLVGLRFLRSARIGLVSPVLRVPAPDDRVFRLDGRYEYRRSFLRDRWIRGLEFAAGPTGLVAWQRLERAIPPRDRLTVSDIEGGGGGLLDVRLARWSRIAIEGGWTAALVLGRTRHVLDGSGTAAQWQGGGGWLLSDHVGASIRLNDRFQLTVAYQRTGQARFASHRSQSDRRDRLEVGVTHVR